MDSIGRYQSCPKWLIAICACALLVFSASLHATEHKTVLILHSFGREFRPWNEYAKQIRAELDRQSPWPLDVQEHSLETARSGNLNPEIPFVEYLGALYADHAPDLIVTIGGPATAFVQRQRDRLFPDTPAVFTAIEQRRLQNSGLTRNDAVIAVTFDFRLAFESFLRISPDTRIVAIVNGRSPNELFWRGEIERELRPLEDRIEIRWYDNLSFQNILKQTASLPPHSAIYWNTMDVDATGAAHEGDAALTALHATANAPMFTADDAFFGRDVVGGPMVSPRVLGIEAGAVAVRILGGEKPDSFKIAPVGFAAPKYDWRELQRWGISESRLPPGSVIYFREPTAWEKYPWQISLALAAILIQAALIAGLLYEHRGRRFAEVQSRHRMSELARANRFATAGELAASIAHEINQPLGAIQTNTEALDLVVNSPSPDLAEIKEIVTDIRSDQERASEVIRRLRSLLKKAPFEIKDIDLNDVVRETEKFISALFSLAVASEVDLSTSLTPEPLPIRGDRIQLEQVILNLIMNAIDAMSEMPRSERKVTIRTAGDRDLAEVSISDAGPGIPADKLRKVFEPFFTTKPQGMGIGLSIVRTIVEAHGGRIVAENQAGGGAVFRLKFPLSQRQ